MYFPSPASALQRAHLRSEENTCTNAQTYDSPLRNMESRNSRTERISVILIRRRRAPIQRNHANASLAAQPKQMHRAAILDRKDVLLAVLRVDALLLVVIEERVHPRAVEEHIL